MALHITSSSRVLKIPKPTTKEELQELIRQELERQGPDADLNFIDVSDIEDMTFLFHHFYIRNIKIDYWDVSNVRDMSNMFYNCPSFNCDLSNWDVHNVRNMYGMFMNCHNFNCNLRSWNMSKVTDVRFMFAICSSFDNKNKPKHAGFTPKRNKIYRATIDVLSKCVNSVIDEGIVNGLLSLV
jgi:surface protein